MSHDFSLSQSQLPPPGALLEVVFDDETGFGDSCLQNGRCFDHFALSKLCFGSHLTETQDGVTQSFYTDVAAELCGDTEELGGQAMGNLILCTHIMNHCMIQSRPSVQYHKSTIPLRTQFRSSLFLRLILKLDRAAGLWAEHLPSSSVKLSS